MILIKNIRLIDPKTNTDKKVDIYIKDGKVEEIGENIIGEKGVEIIEADKLLVAPGLIDVHVHFRDPGFTEKEDIYTGSRSAARGGFTTVMALANTNPVVDNVNVLKDILDRAKDLPIELMQIAAVTKDMNGRDINDLKALKEAGAIGFSDDGKPLTDTKIVKKIMEITRDLNMVLSLHEEDPSLIDVNGINKYSPREAEESMVARDIALGLRIGGKVNIQHISSKNSVDLVRWAKKKGGKIYAEVTPHHFTLTEEALEKNRALAKMNPPLRRMEDLEAIVEGLKDNTIEIIATDHAPHTREEKEMEIEKAPSGIIGLETALSLGITNLVDKGHLSIMELIEKMTINPAKLYEIDRGYIERGHRADLVIFSLEEEYVVEDNFYSKSSNSPFVGEKLKGKVKMTIAAGKIVYREI